MSTLIIPFRPSVPNYEFTTVLDNTKVTFDVLWNARDNAWYFDLYARDLTPIAFGIKVVLGVNLGRKSTDIFFQQNLLRAFDTSGKGRDAGIDDLGARVIVRRYAMLDLIFGTQQQ